ncbi:MAG: type II secretion system protein GspL [Desulfobacteraceae bacterium]|jgi:type II secretion system protein L
MSRKVLGIDIRKHLVVAVLVNSGLRESRIVTHTVIPISHSNEDDNDTGLKAAIERLSETIDIGDCDCVVSIPADHFSFRNLQVPFSSMKKIKMVLPYELEPNLPYPIDALAFDFQTIETVETGENTELIAATVERSRLTPYVDALSAFKIDPETVTISGLPLALCLASQSDPGEDQLLVEISDRTSTLIATVSGQIQLIRSFPIPAAGPTRSKMLATQIKRTLAAFEEINQPDFQPLEILITGDGLMDENLTDELARVTEIPVKLSRLANRLNVLFEADVEDTWNPTLMDNALALALMEIEDIDGLNFHAGQFAVQKFIAKNKSQVMKTGILAAAVLILFLINVLVDSFTVQRRLDRLDDQITAIYKSTFPGVKKIMDPYQEMKAKLRVAKKKSVFHQETGPHVRSIDILNNISKRITKEIVVDITRLVIGPQTVLISGNTAGFDSVDDIKGRLEQIDFFKKVTISSANMDRSGKEVRFMLKAEL